MVSFRGTTQITDKLHLNIHIGCKLIDQDQVAIRVLEDAVNAITNKRGEQPFWAKGRSV